MRVFEGIFIVLADFTVEGFIMSLIRNRFHYIKIFITLVNFYYMHAYPQKKNFIDIYEAICLYLERNMLNFALEFIMYVEFKYVQMKDHTFFQPEMIMK